MIIVEAGVLPRIKQFNMGNSGLNFIPAQEDGRYNKTEK